jgi:hypothetical protein
MKNILNSKNFAFTITSLLLMACSTPKAWIEKKSETGGVIAYKNYDPSKDNNDKINKLIWCKDGKHKMVSNTIKYEPTGFETFAANASLEDESQVGIQQVGLYQFECQ